MKKEYFVNSSAISNISATLADTAGCAFFHI